MIRPVPLVLLAVLFFAPAAGAQTTRFMGTVVDPDGEPICDAVVHIESMAASDDGSTAGDKSFTVEAKMACKKKKARFAAFMQKLARAYVVTVKAPGYRTHREVLEAGVKTQGELNVRFNETFELQPLGEGETNAEEDEDDS